MRLFYKKTAAAKVLLCLAAALCPLMLCWGEPAAAGPVRGRPEPVSEERISLLERAILAGRLTMAPAEDPPRFPAMSYQIYGRDFILPVNKELGLSQAADYAGLSPAWGLLRAAWPGADLLPLDHLSLDGDYEVFLAAMNSDCKGRPVAVPQDASFISGQQWGEIKGEALLEGLALLPPGRNTGLGILYRDDYSLMVMSARLPQAEPSGDKAPGQKEEAIAPDSAPAVMVSSLSLVRGVPVVIGLSSAHASDIPLMWNICHSLTLYLQLSNNPPAEGFFNPRPDNLVIAGRRLAINLPPDQCLLKADNLKTLVMLLQLETMSRGILLPFMAYAPCADLAAWLEEKNESALRFYGILAVNLENGQLKLRDELGGEQFLESLRREQPEEHKLDAERLDQSSWEEILQNMPEGTWEELGHFGVDNRAGYWAILIKGHSGDASFLQSSQAGIMGVGLVNNLVITSMLYMNLDEADPYRTLLSAQRRLFEDLR